MPSGVKGKLVDRVAEWDDEHEVDNSGTKIGLDEPAYNAKEFEKCQPMICFFILH